MKKAVAILLVFGLLIASLPNAFASQSFDPSAYSEEELRGFISQASGKYGTNLFGSSRGLNSFPRDILFARVRTTPNSEY